MNGQGKLTFKNGDLYEGTFKNNFYDGSGVFTYINGACYNGEWK